MGNKYWNKVQAVLEFIGVLITGALLIAAIVLGFKFIGGIITYIKEYKPDTVIILYTAMGLGIPSMETMYEFQ